MKAIIKLGRYYLLHIIPYYWIINIIDKKVMRYNGTNQQALACLNFPVRKTEYIRKNDLYPLTEGEFEGIKVMLPKNYEVYLTTHYGNFRELPSEEKRVGHRPYIVDLGEQE